MGAYHKVKRKRWNINWWMETRKGSKKNSIEVDRKPGEVEVMGFVEGSIGRTRL